ncbi:MAG: peptidase T [Clostridia bacterium]|nr:peptidase T [Clostridia bacterium]
MSVKERFLRYIQIETTSDEASPTCPSTAWQKNLGKLLAEELRDLGIRDARMDENGYVYGTIPAKGASTVKLGLIAHMDTSDAVKGPTHPVEIPAYPGGPITLKNGTVIDGFSFLDDLVGQDLIVTDGTSVLGADDKAGVAEIMALAELLMREDDPDHCEVHIGFTPDEEIGRGPDLFDVPGFGATYGYTIDGGALGEVEFENFNAASCLITVTGLSIHPGSAKNQMINAAAIATEFHRMLPQSETPEHTEGYEGFYHLNRMEGDCEKAILAYILRDHDKTSFEKRKETCRQITQLLNQRYGDNVVRCDIKDSYANMREIIAQHPEIITKAKEAFTACDVTPIVQPIRGGTDGARLSFMGLPCPNLSTGGYNFHSRKELISVQAMEKMVEVLTYLVSHTEG